MRMPPKRKKRIYKHPAAPLRYLTSLVRGRVQRQLFDDLTAYCMFIGYPRSGHSIVGAFLDAHPEMVISNELGAIELFKRGYGRNQVCQLILADSRRLARAGRSNSGYNYQVAGQWQGRERTIRVIGDKEGGNSSRLLGDDANHYLLQRIPELMGVPLRLIHVIRNPFDIVSTMIGRVEKRTGRSVTPKIFEREFSEYESKVITNRALIEREDLAIHHIFQEDFVGQPAEHLRQLCDFLGVAASPDYLADCAAIVRNTPNQSRFKTDLWTPERIERVNALKNSADFLRHYTFTGQ